MKKIVIIGPGGAGKSTLAIQLSSILKIDIYHLDHLFWKPNWEGISKDQQIIILNDLMKKEEWIIDGNYGGTLDMRLQGADTIILLDFPRVLCLFRVIKRFFKFRNKTRPDMSEGCREKLDFNFLKWIWNYRKKRRPVVIDKLKNLTKDKKVYILQSPRKVKLFLKSLRTK